MKRGREGQKKFPFFVLPHPILNDQTLILLNFEDLVLLSPSEIKRELCELMISIGQGIDRYKVPMVGKNCILPESGFPQCVPLTLMIQQNGLHAI